MHSRAWHKPWACRTRKAYNTCAHDAITDWTWGDTNKPLVIVTPRIFITFTRCSWEISIGSQTFSFRLRSTKMISWLFAKLSLRLLCFAQSVIWLSSVDRESILTAGMIRYVSSAYLRRKFPSKTQLHCSLTTMHRKMLLMTTQKTFNHFTVRSTHVREQPQFRTKGFCCSKVILPTGPSWQQLVDPIRTFTLESPQQYYLLWHHCQTSIKNILKC